MMRPFKGQAHPSLGLLRLHWITYITSSAFVSLCYFQIIINIFVIRIDIHFAFRFSLSRHHSVLSIRPGGSRKKRKMHLCSIGQMTANVFFFSFLLLLDPHLVYFEDGTSSWCLICQCNIIIITTSLLLLFCFVLSFSNNLLTLFVFWLYCIRCYYCMFLHKSIRF